MEIRVFNRNIRKVEKEKVYGAIFLDLLYGDGKFERIFSSIFLPLLARSRLFSKLSGAFYRSRLSRKKIIPFIRGYHIDEKEFLKPVSSFKTFNEFFIRKLRSEVRPFVKDPKRAILPADARYVVVPNLQMKTTVFVKGKSFSLERLLGSKKRAEKFIGGDMLMARLCPTDYHRFHFPFDCTPSKTQLINGFLYSVNPIALKKNISIIAENKRVITELHSEVFGNVLFIDVGATNVGTIRQTFNPLKPVKKGDEKGYFSFGGSCILILFQKDRIEFDQDLCNYSKKGIEVRAQFGDSMGRAKS